MQLKLDNTIVPVQKAIGSAPWDRPIWKPTKGKGAIFLYLVLIHVLAVTGLLLFPIPSLQVAVPALILVALGGLGTTVGYHRALSHRTLKLNRAVEQVLIFFAMFNGSGAPASWVAYHRHHHSKVDTLEDISSPTHGGFWWAHLRWLYQSPPADSKRWAPELDKGVYTFWMYAEIPVILLSLFGGVLLGWQGFF